MTRTSDHKILRNRFLSIILIATMILPAWMSIAQQSTALNTEDLRTDADLVSLYQMGVEPRLDASSGWVMEGDSTEGTVHLHFRDARPISLNEWANLRGDIVTGWVVLQHTMPVPTQWIEQLAQAGIECFTYVPDGAFHCSVPSLTIETLAELEVNGIMELDPTDKVHRDIDNLLSGEPINGIFLEGRGIFSVFLSGMDTPQIDEDDSLQILDKSTRWMIVIADGQGIARLANSDAVEWIGVKRNMHYYNDIGRDIIEVDWVESTANMDSHNAGWTGLTGAGVQVTVADSGLDSGLNDASMHDDFQGRINAIESWPIPDWIVDAGLLAPGSGPGQAGNVDDGAGDVSDCLTCGSGHGTHVAGSVLGDGTMSGGLIVGSAPGATLHFQATEQYVDWSMMMEAQGFADGYGLRGLPPDLNDLFLQAYENGSRIHTNSWGSSVNGEYDDSAQQTDQAAYTYQDMLIIFAASNDGIDANSDGEVDGDSLGSPGTAKSALTVGASENGRTTLPSDSGTWMMAAWGSATFPAEPLYSDLEGGDIDGMAAFSSRGPTDDLRQKPDISAPGTWILSTRSRSSTSDGALAYDANHVYMSGTSMATPLTAGAAALILEHLNTNEGVVNPSSALVRAMFVASADDMLGQYGDPNNGAGEDAPNPHEGWGRIDVGQAINSSYVDGDTVATGEFREYITSVPSGMSELRIVLSYTDPASSSLVGTQLVNDLDVEIVLPDGSTQTLSNDLDPTRGIILNSPDPGIYEIYVNGTNVPIGPQPFAIAVNVDSGIANGTNDMDFDGVDDDIDNCLGLSGTSSVDRLGCPDTDGDGYSDPDGVWTVGDGADAFPTDSTQWGDNDGDGYGDEVGGTEPDSCVLDAGTSTIDRFGCPDTDNDGYSNPDGGWLVSDGADSCSGTIGNSSEDRFGCLDTDGDGYSDPDPSGTHGPIHDIGDGADAWISDPTQWTDTDGDGYGDNPPPATDGDHCPNVSGTSTADRIGCLDTDGDGYSDPDSGTLAHPIGLADAFPNDDSQARDTDGDGYGDNWVGINADDCVNTYGLSNQNGTLGCPDADGDGWADTEDPIPDDGTQWIDTDGDGYGDDPAGNNPDIWINDPTQWEDLDGDGAGDNPDGTDGDQFPGDGTQWDDADGDGYGDNPAGTEADDCPSVAGISNQNGIFGCADTDGDGYSDSDDDFPNEPTQHADSDADGYGDNQDGVAPDGCPSTPGNSTENWNWGCVDTDGDGYADADDAIPNLAGQWEDLDGDGYGDDQNGPQYDACIFTPGTSTIDRYGCLDTDGDGYSDLNDDFPNDSQRDTDSDADGYDTTEDVCPEIYGLSTEDRLGCPDSDGDGYSDEDVLWTVADGADAFALIPDQWNDTDDDGYGDNPNGTNPDSCNLTAGDSILDRFGCPDSDADGWSDANDTHPSEQSQWADADQDGYGDNPDGFEADGCPGVAGTSSIEPHGCIDSDGDGAADTHDPLPDDPSQSTDSDGDGFGDNEAGTSPDSCPMVSGTSHLGYELGCPDSDGDGYSDSIDALPDESTQWLDSDGDGFGNDDSIGALWVDHYPFDSTRALPSITMVCSPLSAQILIDSSDDFISDCAITNTMDHAVRIMLDIEYDSALSTSQTVWYIDLQPAGAVGDTKAVSISLSVSSKGDWDGKINLRSIGDDSVIDSLTFTIQAYETVDEMPVIVEDSLAVFDPIFETLEPYGPHAVPAFMLALVATVISLQALRVRGKRKKQRRARASFKASRLSDRKDKPSEAVRWARHSTGKPSHRPSDAMSSFTGVGTESRSPNRNQMRDGLLND